MNSKKWIKILLILCVFGVGFVGGVNYLVDPFQQYRVKTFYPIAFKNERYQNAGLAKNFNYDSLILGTSMTENFLIDKVENDLGFKKAIKLSVSGGSAREQSITLQTAINNNKNLKNVLWGFDTFAFIGEPDRLRYGENSFPFYLYDDKKLNDYKYILSIDTIKDSMKSIINPYRKKDELIYDYNRMYEWQYLVNHELTIEKVKKDWDNRSKFINYEQNKQSFSYLKNNFDLNFYQIIKNNPKIKFKIFFPPYSILNFKALEERDKINDILEFKKYIYNTLLELENVNIYDFQSEKIITHNLANYKDISHYHQNINNWLTEQIRDNKYLVTKENRDEHLENLRKQIEEYDLAKVK